MIDSNGKLIGFDVAVAKLIAQKLNKELVFKDMCFDALIVGLKQGRIDLAISGISITKQRLEKIHMIHYCDKPLTTLPLIFWQQVPNNIHSVYDLRFNPNNTVCVQAGTFQEEIVSQYDFLNIKHLETVADLIMDIKYGKSIATVLEPRVALALLKNFPDLKIIDIQLKPEEQNLGTGIGINKQNINLINQVEECIAEFKANKILQSLETKWFKQKLVK
jgi:polar amino acid transport system substrate-binding protein